ncbi:MAG: ABC transporter permease [Gemmataceae bacterium]|nr:ABC transporter permease [Gemmataceae bacterium]
MLGFRLLPWEYGVRNLFRRPGRSVLTLGGLTLVVLLVFVVVGFVRGLETSLAVSGDPRVVLIHSLGGGDNLENSSIPARSAALLSASLEGVQRRQGTAYASPELFLGTNVSTEGDAEPAMGAVRGITPAAILVRRRVQVIEGAWPKAGEVLVGRLASAKLGRGAAALAVGRTLAIEGQSWRVSGHFAATGSALEAELWCPLEDLQRAMKRQDISLVAVTLAPGLDAGVIDEFCKERLDLELAATPETGYYASLQKHYKPVRTLAWLMMCLVAGAGVFAGLNTMYGSVVGRIRELATLQTVGFSRRAITIGLIQEATLLAAAGAVVAAVIALLLINGAAVRFTSGAFVLRIDSVALLIGCGTGLMLGFVGALPPAFKALRMPIIEGLKAV